MPLNTGKYSNNESIIYKYLVDNGFNQAQVCGFLANIEHECNFNPRVTNSIGAFGICQWLSGRKSTLLNKYGSNPSLQQQLSYIIYEITQVAYERQLYNNYIKNISNNRSGAYDAGYKIAQYYERCESEWRVPRAQRAQVYWDYYVVGKAADQIKVVGDTSLSTDSTRAAVAAEADLPAYISLATVNSNASYVESNLSRVTVSGYDYGYLIDLVTKDEFKFYIPEFSESAGASWGGIDIPGRSVKILSYESTNSRKISISLELYAGAGLYASGEDVVGKMHSDLNFVKSLEYPDYDNFITKPPASVQLILGPNINIVGVVNDVNVEHMKPLDTQNRSMYVKLSFSVTQVASNPPGYKDIRKGNYTITSTENPGSMSK